MTATPIPRTLALTLYGDLDVSVIDELPPGRQPIVTRVFNETRARARARLVCARSSTAGRQAYVVYPLVRSRRRPISSTRPAWRASSPPGVVPRSTASACCTAG